MARKDATSRRRLGKGLGSLISAPAAPVEVAAPPPASTPEDRPGGLLSIPLASIKPNPRQPRKDFDDEALESLTQSIRSAGVMQPVVVRQQGDAYELVAGERRWRAAQRAGLETIPAIVRTADDQEMAEWSLIENLQREDLNPVERAEAFRRLVDDFGLTHEAVGQVVGLQRSSVSNHLRLLDLEPQIQELLRLGMLGQGHARALLSIEDLDLRRRLAIKAAREGWSVRAVEREVARHTTPRTSEAPAKTISRRDANLADLERRLADHLGTRVKIRPGKKKGTGRLVLDFFDMAQFEGILERLGVDPS